MSQVRVTIAGKLYALQSTEEERYVIELAKCLDKGIKEIMAQDGALSLTSACILAAMDILDEKTKISKESDSLRFQIKNYIDETIQAEAKVEELERQVAVLEQKNKELVNEINLYSLKETLDDNTK